MEDAARKRKERLAALKAKLQNGTAEEATLSTESSINEVPPRSSSDRHDKRPREETNDDMETDDMDMNGNHTSTYGDKTFRVTCIRNGGVTVEEKAGQIQDEIKEQIKEMESNELVCFNFPLF